MLDVGQKAGILVGLEGGRPIQDLPGWRERFRGVPQNSVYSSRFELGESASYRVAAQFGLGVPAPSRIPLAPLDIEHFKRKLREKHSGLLFGGGISFGTSFGTTRLSDLVEHLIPEIMRAIEASRDILDMGGDWDSEGSVGYSESTWNRATEFLKRSAFALRVHHGREVQAPRILHGPEGGIDLHWRTTSHELLINIPADPGEPADFYGVSGPSNTIKGKLETSAQNEWILMWLMS